MSVYGGLGGVFTHCVRVDLGSRGRFCLRTNFTHFHCDGGDAPKVDFGYMFMIQSTIDFGRISRIFSLKVYSDPDGLVPG